MKDDFVNLQKTTSQSLPWYGQLGQVAQLNEQLASKCALERMRYIISFAKKHQLNVVQTTSFGIQSALMIHLLAKTEAIQHVHIIFIDTGFLPKETYTFAEEMRTKYNLNLCIYQSTMSPARMEALYGKLWEDSTDTAAHEQYNQIRKVSPMNDALHNHDADIILTGLRASQTSHRKNLSFVNVDGARLKVCPILDWDDDMVDEYFRIEKIPFHPLYYEGYRSVGDWHSSQPYNPEIHSSVRDSRFHGRTQECGLHVSISNISFVDQSNGETEASLASTETSQQHSFFDGYVIYVKPNCKYCRAAKAILATVAQQIDPGVAIVQVQVGQEISQEGLIRKLGRIVRTVPQIVYYGEYIGGYDALCLWGAKRYSNFHKVVENNPLE